jgi:tyrosyl-tRNA synthetase
MSKSLRNAVALEDSPDEMFGRLMSIPDSLIASYTTLLTDLDPDANSQLHPRDAKVYMARSVVSQFHGEDNANRAIASFEKVFSRKELPEEIPVFHVREGERVRLSTVMVQSGAAKSESQAKQLIRQGAVDWNGETIQDPFMMIEPKNDLLKVGKRFYCRVQSIISKD